MELFFNLKKFYDSKQSGYRKPVPFICSQNPHGLFAVLVSSVSLTVFEFLP